MNNQFAIAVKCLIYSGDKILLLTKAKAEDKNDPYKSRWDLPGGRVEFTETPEEAVKREVFEEVSLQIEKAALKSTHTVIRQNKIHLLILFYKSHCTNPKISLSEEHTSFNWFSFEEIEKEPSMPEWIKKAVTT